MNEKFRNYAPPISQELRIGYERALSNVARWEGGILIPLRPENDYEHVMDGFGIMEQIGVNFPKLAASFDARTIEDMWYVHDAGEIIAKDLPHSHPQYDVMKPKVKAREARAIRHLTRQYIADLQLREYIRDLYSRYEKPSADDKESYYVHLIDMVQGTRYGLVYVFHGKGLTREQRKQQLNHTYGKFIKPTRALFSLLDDGAKVQLEDFVVGEFNRFEKNGYTKREVAIYTDQFARDLSFQTA